MGTMLMWSVFLSVTRPLLSYRFVVGKHPQDTLVGPLIHTSRFDRHRTVRAPFEPSAQLLYTTRRAVPPVAHRRLIGDASAFAATEKPNAVVRVPGIQDARCSVAFAAHEHEVTPAEMCFLPIADDGLPYRVQRFAAGGPARKSQHQPLCIRAAGHLKPDGPNSNPRCRVSASPRAPVHERQAARIARREACLLNYVHQNRDRP